MRYFIYFRIKSQPIQDGLVYWYRLSDKPYRTQRGLKTALDSVARKHSLRAYELATINTETTFPNPYAPPLYLLEGSTYAAVLNLTKVVHNV
jgi:hypothetical protein